MPDYLREKMQASLSSGERRRVTILFADIEGFTSLSERLDPEVVYSLMNSWSKSLAACIYEFEGYVDKFIGDEVMALFGAPIAHEDDPERAIRAAIRMQETMREINRRAEIEWHVQLSLRVGIHTGLVVAGGMGADLHLEYTVMGDVVNTTARLQGHADPGSILVSDTVRRATERQFVFGPPLEAPLRGRSQPIEAYQVIGIKSTPEVARGLDGFSCPIIGRDDEIGSIRAAVTDLRAGKGKLLSLTGSAGLGKSRLIREIRQEMDAVGIPHYLGRCYSYGTGIPYMPLQSILLRLLHAREDDDDPTLQLRAASACRAMAKPPETVGSPIGLILRREWGDPDQRAFDPQIRRLMAHEAFATLLFAEAARTPLAIIIDDLHWSDKESLDLLEFIAPQTESAPILLLTAYRPELKPSWAGLPSHEELRLRPLTNPETSAMLDALLGNRNTPREINDLLLDKSEGNPFFLEELMRTLIDTGSLERRSDAWELQGPVESIELPDTLHAVVLARLDRLDEPTRRTLQRAAVIGRSFPIRVLERLEDAPERLEDCLAEMRRLEFIYERSGTRVRECAFRQAVTQEVAYETLLLATRRKTHGDVARAMEHAFADRLEEHLPHLAFHYVKSEDRERALRFSVLAGDQAARAYALSEMREHYEDALRLLEDDPDLAASETSVEVHIHETLADSHFLAGEYDQAEDRYHRAYSYCGPGSEPEAGLRRAAGLERKRAIALFRLGKADAAIELLQASRLGLSPMENSWTVDCAANDAWLAWIFVIQGQLQRAAQLAEVALQGVQGGESAPNWGLPIAVSGNQKLRESARGLAENVLGLVALFRCQWTDAEIHYERSLEQFEAAGDTAFYAGVLGNLATVHMACARYSKALDCAGRSLVHQERIGFILGQIVCHSTMGYTYMTVGEYRRSHPHLIRCLDLAKTTGDHRNISDSYVNLALLHLAVGAVGPATDALDSARSTLNEGEDPGLDASLLHALGLLRQEEMRFSEAGACFKEAIALARRLEIPDTEVHSMTALAQALLDEGDLLATESIVIDLLSRDRSDLPESARVKALRCRGMLDLMHGRWEEAERGLLDSRRICETLGLRHDLAGCDLRLGQLYAAQGKPNDAKQTWNTALELCQEIGADGDVVRLQALIRDLPSSPGVKSPAAL